MHDTLPVMIEIWRQGENGNMLEANGPVLWLNIGEIVIEHLMKNERSIFRWAELPRGAVHGFAHEDKVHVIPEDLQLIEAGVARHIGIDMDPGGDIYIKLSREAGKGVKGPGDRGYRVPAFNIKDISSTTEEFSKRGLEAILLPNLWVVENKRRCSEP